MNIKTFKRGLSLLFVMLLAMSCFVLTPIQAQAASGTIKVRMVNVIRRYSEAKGFLDKINAYRAKNSKTALVMDATYLENAMIRAAEAALYADTSTSPNGKPGTQYLVGTTNGGQLVGYDVRSLDALLTSFQSDSTSNSYLLNSSYESVGIGDVSVNGYKYICVLVSSKTAVPPADSVLAQSTVTQEQEIETLPEHLSEMTSPYSSGYGVNCGGSLAAYVKVKNKLYPSASVFLSPYGASVSLSNKSVFEFKNNKLYAISPGTCKVTITFPNTGGTAAVCQLQAIGKKFSSCTFDDIPDQIYTGYALVPKVTIRDSNSLTLTNGTDYTLTYANNINIGTANITVIGKGDYEGQSKTLYFNIVSGGNQPSDSLTVTIVTSSSNISLGQSVTITAIPSGGTAPISYTYSYTPYNTTNWKTLLANTTKTTCTFKPTEAQMYLVKVSAVDSKGLAAQQSAMVIVKDSLSLTASVTPSAPVVSGTVKLTASSSGGVAPVKYAFYIMKPSGNSWITLSDYSTTKTADFKPTMEGTYQICVKAKSATDELVKKYLSVKVTASTLKNSSTVSSVSIDLGTSVTLKGVGSGGVTPYTYAFYAKKSSSNSWTTLRDYNVANTVTFKPSAATTYNLCIKVKDATDRVEKRYIDMTVYPKLVNNSTISSSSILLGKSVTIKGEASGGKSSYQYSYWYRAETTSAFSKIKDYSTTQTVTFTPKAVGRFYIRVKVKDSNGSVVNRDYFVDVTSTLANKSTVSASSVAAGKTITITCSASGGTSPYQYAVYYIKPGTQGYVKSSDYAATTSRTVKLSAKGTYTIRVKVKDAAGTIINKDFTVKTT